MVNPPYSSNLYFNKIREGITMKLRNISYFIIIFSIMITLVGCNRIEAIEFEGLNISTNDNFHLIKGELYVKEKWSFSEKKKVFDIIQRMTSREEELPKGLIGMPPVLRIETDDCSVFIMFGSWRSSVTVSRAGIADKEIWYECSEEDTITIASFILPKGWNDFRE